MNKRRYNKVRHVHANKDEWVHVDRSGAAAGAASAGGGGGAV